MAMASAVAGTRSRGQSKASSRRSRTRRCPRPRASGAGDGGRRQPTQPQTSASLKLSAQSRLREEVTAPFRTFRIFMFGALGASAGIGTATALLKSVASLMHAPAAGDLTQNLQNVGIDVVALVVCVALYRRDAKAREAAVERIEREERLAELPVEISIGADKRRRVPLGRLRGFVRPVVAAGSAADVDALITKALEMSDALEEKGVVICPVILDQFSSADGRSIPELVDGWRGGGKVICVPVNVRLWQAWIERQMQIAGVEPDRGVYLSLRMDGRVRASGKGMPPLERIAASLPPAEAWSGFLSGFDGSVNPLQ